MGLVSSQWMVDSTREDVPTISHGSGSPADDLAETVERLFFVFKVDAFAYHWSKQGSHTT